MANVAKALKRDLVEMGKQERDRRCREIQLQAKRLGVSVITMLLTRSELYWAMMLNGPVEAQYISEE